MKSFKHVGKMVNTGAKVLVVFRTLPGESNMALVLPVAQLPDAYHDKIMEIVETAQAQDSFEFGEMMFMRSFTDGRPMLQAMQVDGRLHKVATDTVIMTPTPSDSIVLSELNILVAEQKNCTIDDLYTFVSGAPKKAKDKPSVVTPVVEAAPMTDKDLAKSYRSQADAMYKEAAKLRKDADVLDPAVKKVTKAKEPENA